MPRFRCNNTECQDFEKEELIPRVKFIWNEDTFKFEADEEICPACRKRRETVREPGPIKMPWFKAENSRNYNNKKVKQYDYDRSAVRPETVKIPGAPRR
jgi:hypothetical protein